MLRLLGQPEKVAPEPEACLGRSPWITTGSPRMREVVAPWLSLGGPRARAVASHDWVRDQIPFGWTGAFWRSSADELLSLRRGYCVTKSSLWVALLRTMGIPARLRFVALDAQVLHGLVAPGAWLDHAYVELWLEGQWLGVDSHVVDAPLFAAAQARLRQEERDMGYGVAAQGSCQFNGHASAYSQCVGGAEAGPWVARDFGHFEDASDFYRRALEPFNGGLLPSLYFSLLGSGVQARLEALRRQSLQNQAGASS